MSSLPSSPCRKDSFASLTPTYRTQECGDEDESSTKCCGLNHISKCFTLPRQRGFKLKNTCLGTNLIQYCEKYIERNNQNGIDEEAAKIIQTCDEIQKQITDPCKYRYIELQNGIRMLLVSNVDSQLSGAALDIKVGSFYDPVHLQGLCHLCEHVLFTGSEQYPNDSYSSFLSQRGGSSNAFTSSEHTNFHFDIPSEHFSEALQRFISFFTNPIFRQTSVKNEVETVQSEHEKNRCDDVWRTNQVERATANSNHAFSHFSTGTRHSLEVSRDAERNLRYELFTFFKTNYSSNLMSVCLIHNKSLEDMEELAKLFFLSIQNKNIPERIWPNNPFRNSQMRTKLYVVPIKDIYHVNLTFPMEDMCQFYASSPDGYVSQLIGYKGPGGLFSYLRRNGLAHHIVAGCKTLARGFSFFMITVQLTDRGERSIDDVIKLVFQYIHLLKETGPLQWFFDEIHHLSIAQFEHKETSRVQSYASEVAGWLHMYPPKDVLAASYVYSAWRPDLIDRVYAYLSPDNLRVTVLSKRSRFFATQVEPHYGTEYHVEKIPRPVLIAWRNCSFNEELKLPQPNDLIDRSNKMVPCDHQRENGLPELFLFVERIRMKAWFLPCTYFKLPRAFLYIKFYVPSLVSSNSRNCTINNIFVFLIRDLLTEYSYCGQLAGLFYSLKPTKCGIELSVRGYSSKQHIYLGKILSTIYATRKIFSKDRFEQVKDIHRKGIESAEAEPLKTQAKHLLSHILCPKTFHRSDRLQQLSTVSYEDVLSYADDFILHHSVECFFFGNLTMGDAENLANAAVEARKKYLEERAKLENLKVDVDPYLEEWFLKSPVERIVVLESALRKEDMEQNTSNDGDILTEGNPSTENIQSKSGCNISSNISANDVSYRSVSEYVHDREDQLSTIEEEKGHHNTGNTTDEDIITGQNKNTRQKASFENSTKIEIVLPRSKNRQNLFIVNNEVQSSSCVSFYLQFTQNLPNHSALLEMFNQTIREHLVSSMRYIEALGYVIGCDIRQGNANTTIGLRITVESHYPLPVVHARIEESILSLDEFLSSMSEETFQMGKSARIIGKRELWNNRMIDRAVSLWREIADETYYFNRNQDEIEEIEKISLTHVRDFYNTWIHPAGEERRHLTISIGPDPMLNKLDIMLEGNGEHQVRHWNLKELEIYRNNAKSFPLVSSEVLSRWYQQVFDSEDNNYQPPHSMI